MFSAITGPFYGIELMRFSGRVMLLLLLLPAAFLCAGDLSVDNLSLLPRAEDLVPDVVAEVNGVELTRDQLAGLAISVDGAALVQALLHRELVRQEAEKQGITISEQEFEAYLQERVEREMQGLARQLGAKSPEETEEILRAQRIPVEALRENTRRALRPHVAYELLRKKLVRQTIALSESDLQTAFSQRYGPKVSVKQIVLPTREHAEKVIKMLESGVEFEDAVSAFSSDPVSRREGGQLPPLPVDSELGRAAVNLQPGKFSDAVKIGDNFHILKLVEKIEAEDVRFDEVRDALREELTQRMAAQKMRTFLEELQHKANIESRWEDWEPPSPSSGDESKEQ